MNALSTEELNRRRAASRKLAWLLGGLVLLIYAIGLFVPR